MVRYVMVMVPHAGKMHFRHLDQQNSSGGGPSPPAWASQLRCSQGRAPPDMVCPPKQKILATPLGMVRISKDDVSTISQE